MPLSEEPCAARCTSTSVSVKCSPELPWCRGRLARRGPAILEWRVDGPAGPAHALATVEAAASLRNRCRGMGPFSDFSDFNDLLPESGLKSNPGRHVVSFLLGRCAVR